MKLTITVSKQCLRNVATSLNSGSPGRMGLWTVIFVRFLGPWKRSSGRSRVKGTWAAAVVKRWFGFDEKERQV